MEVWRIRSTGNGKSLHRFGEDLLGRGDPRTGRELEALSHQGHLQRRQHAEGIKRIDVSHVRKSDDLPLKLALSASNLEAVLGPHGLAQCPLIDAGRDNG